MLAGAIIGALCAAGLLSSCTANYSQSAAGDIAFKCTVVVPGELRK